MKNLLLIIFTMGILLFISSCLFGKKNEIKSCFNAENYQKVYDYVVKEKGEKEFLTWGDYQIYPEKDKLRFHIKDSLMGGVTPDKGTYSVWIWNYEKGVKKIDKVFCQILEKIK